MTDLTPETRAEWLDALEKAERERDDLHFSRRQMEKSRDYQKARAEKAERERDEAREAVEYQKSLYLQAERFQMEAERERDEAREALARVEALRDEWERTSRRPCNHGASAMELSEALAGPNPTGTEGDDR